MLKDELGGKTMKKLGVLRTKAYAYLMDADREYKKGKGIKKCIIKRRVIFENYTDYLFNNNTILRSQQLFRSNLHDVYTVEISKIALSSNDDKK